VWLTSEYQGVKKPEQQKGGEKFAMARQVGNGENKVKSSQEGGAGVCAVGSGAPKVEKNPNKEMKGAVHDEKGPKCSPRGRTEKDGIDAMSWKKRPGGGEEGVASLLSNEVEGRH